MDTLHLSARITLRLDLLADVPPGASASDLADGEAASGGKRRHDTPFSFDIVFEPTEIDTLPAEATRDGKGRITTPFTFELTAPGLQTIVVRSVKRRVDTSFSFERRVPPTDGGLMLTAIREAVGISVEVLPVLDIAVGRARTDTTFSFEVSTPGTGGVDSGHVSVSAAVAE